MKIYFKLGEIYDTLNFFEIYFNYDEFVKDINNHNYDVDDCLKHYNESKENIEVLPHLHAFFALNGNAKSLLGDLFFDNIAKISCINDFIKIFENEDLILNRVIEYHFMENAESNDITQNNIKDIYIEQINNLDIDTDSKLGICLILSNYNYIIGKLTDSILTVYNYIEKLFKENNKLISGFQFEKMYLKKLEEIAKVDTFNNSVYCISLLRDYYIQWVGIDQENYILFLGNRYKEVLDKQHEFLSVTYDSIAYVLSSKLKIDIIDVIYKYKRINVADIIKILPTEHSTATIYRLVNNLLDEKVICISGRDNKHVYYSLNFEYFKNARVVLDKFLLYYIK